MIVCRRQIEDFSSKACVHFGILNPSIVPADICKLLNQVKLHLLKARINRERRIPSTTLAIVESIWLRWLGVGETRIDKVCVRHVVNKLGLLDSRRSAPLAIQPSARRTFNFTKVVEQFWWYKRLKYWRSQTSRRN